MFKLLPILLMFALCHGGKKPPMPDKTVETTGKTAQKPGGRKLGSYFSNLAPQPLPFIKTGPDFGRAVARSIDYLSENNKRPGARLASGIPESDLLTTLFTLQMSGCHTPVFLEKYFDFYQINTPLDGDRAQVTGYFTPVMEAARAKSTQFSVPIYRQPGGPDGNLPGRSAINRGALSGKNLEVAFLKNMADLRSIQMQGSCFLKFADGKMQPIGWDGTNWGGKNQLTGDDIFGGKKGRDEFNYVFFKPTRSAPAGAMSEALTMAVSLSVDPGIVPLGATLLAELPGPDGQPDYHLLLAQDVGGGIQGTRRFDLYCGIGQPFSPAVRVNELGKLWLVLPKKN